MDTLPPEKQDSNLDNKKWLRGLVFVLVVVLILLIVGYFAFARNQDSDTQETLTTTATSSTETDSWATYRNEQYGFEIKYPVLGIGQRVTEQRFEDWGPLYDIEYKTEKSSYFFPALGIAVIPNPKKSSLEEYYKDDACLSLLLGEEIRIYNRDGVSWARYFEDGTMPLPDKYFDLDCGPISSVADFLSPSKEFIARIYYNGQDDSYAWSDYDINEIYSLFGTSVSSFKFFEPTDTSTWKTYRNEEFKFQFQYPADWLLESEKYQEDTYISLKSPEKQAYYKARPGIDGEADYWITISPASGLDTWFTSTFADRQGDFAELMPAKASTTVANLPAIEIFDPITEGGCGSNYVAVFFDSYIYKIRAYCNHSSIKTIHSSFKFTQ